MIQNTNSVDNSKIKESLQKTFLEHFKKNKLGYNDIFDQSVFFLKNDHEYYKNKINTRFLSDLVKSTPNEENDTILSTLVRSLIRSKASKVKVSIFIEELVDSLIKLREDQKRVDALIKQYDAYKTKNLIEEYLNNEDYSGNSSEMMNSTLKIYFSGVQGLDAAKYKFSLMTGTLSDKSSLLKKIDEEIFEYKLNHIVKIEEDDQKFASFEDKGSEYFFPEIELFSYELTGKENISEAVKNKDTGTNLLYFFLRIENLNKNYEDVMFTEQKSLLELFLQNLIPLMNNGLTKTFYTDCAVKNLFNSILCKLKIVIDFDPTTISTIFIKIVELLKNIISFKILVDHKWKTIIKYFPELEDDLFCILGLKEKIESLNEGKCLIY